MNEKTGRMMRQNPTGNNLLEGNMVLTYTTTDPEDSQLTAPDGSIVLWNDSGTLRLRGYSRETGWQTL